MSTTGAAALLCATPIAAVAQAEDEDADSRDRIVVTASKRAQTLQDVPFSVNAQTEADIERLGLDSVEDLSRNVAGLTIQNLGPGQSQVAIRGVSAGQIVRDQPGVKEQVGIYLDESVISLSLFTPDLDLYDLERVETLRGPQGTLYGAGSVGGTIRYITNKPDPDAFEAKVEAEANTITEGGSGGHLKGAVNIPFGDGSSALRVAGFVTEYGGYIDALTRDGLKDDVNSGTRYGGRAAATFAPAEGLSITPRVVYQNIEFDGFNRSEEFNIFANPDTLGDRTLSDREQFLRLDEAFEDEFLLLDLTVEYDLGFATLTSISSFTDREILVSRDASALTHSVSLDLGLDVAATDIPSNLRDETEYESFTQEVRLASNGEGRLNWVAGAFYADIQREYGQSLPTPGYDAFVDAALGAGTSASVANGFAADSPFNSSLPFDLEQIAAFGEASYDVDDRLTITLGGRYYDFEESRDFITGGLFSNADNVFGDETSSTGFSPRILATYDVNDGLTLNGQISRGFRLGGVNDPLNLPLCTAEDEAIFGGFQDYDDETLTNYEAGFKANTRALSFNAAVFYNDIEDLQVTLDAGSCSSRIVFNVPESHTLGLEYELAFQPNDNLDIFFSGSVIEAEFDSTVRTGEGDIIGGIEEGNRLASVPELTLALSGVYRFDQPLFGGQPFVSGSFQHVGDRITQPGDQVDGAGIFSPGFDFGGIPADNITNLDLELDAYQTLNFSGGVDWGDMRVTAFVDNALDEDAELSFDRERGGRARLGFRSNQPRTVGVKVNRSF